jgi:hypothetical protein
MNKLYFVASLFMMAQLTGCVTAVTADIPNSARVADINGRKVSISEVSLRASPDLVKVKMSDKVFVTVDGSLTKMNHPNTRSMVIDIFKSHEVTVVDKLEDATIAVGIAPLLKGLDGIEAQLEHSRALADTTGGLVLATTMFKATGGASLISMFIPHDEVESVGGTVYRKPVVREYKGEKYLWPGDGDKDYRIYSVMLRYRLPGKKEEKANETDLFAVEVEEWVKTFVDLPVTTGQIPSASTVAEAK